MDQSIVDCTYQYFDIQIAECEWNSEKAFLFLFQETTQTIQKQVGKCISELFSSLSHNLYTPLNSLKQLSEQCSVVANPAEFQSIRQLIRVNILLMQYQIRDIIDYSTITSFGKLKLRSETFSVEDLLEELRIVFSYNLQEKKLEFNVHVDQKMPIFQNDQNRLQQVLYNLVENAIKFTDRGTISLTFERSGQNQVCITVSDTGVGLSQEQRQYMLQNLGMDKFTAQTYNSHKFKSYGIGTGLDISTKIINQIGPSQKFIFTE